jgi:hypothetical protein
LDQNGLFILNLLDGNRSLGEVARLFKQTRGIEADAALREVTDFCLMMYRSRMLRITPDQQNERCGRSEAPPVRFVQNPEAILAAEGENGGILFLPTTGFRVLNEIGLFIWNMCDGSRCTDDLVREVLSKYDGATGAKVKNDVQGFIDDLMSNFFLWVECAVNG